MCSTTTLWILGGLRSPAESKGVAGLTDAGFIGTELVCAAADITEGCIRRLRLAIG